MTPYTQRRPEPQMLTPEEIQIIRGFASGRDAVIAIHVFGSTATGKARTGSDIDLAVMVSGAFSGMERIKVVASTYST